MEGRTAGRLGLSQGDLHTCNVVKRRPRCLGQIETKVGPGKCLMDRAVKIF